MDVVIRNLTEHTGAEVRGIDFAVPIDEATRAKLNQAFVDRGVLVVRDQRLSPRQLLSAVRLFGDVFPQHNTRFALPDCPEIHFISNQDKFPDGRPVYPRRGLAHRPFQRRSSSKGNRFACVALPTKGGDTQFANMAAAHDALPEAAQPAPAGLMAIHVYQSSHSVRQLMALASAAKERVPNAVLHPIIRTHPETGRRSIYINPIRIEGYLGLDHKEALPLLVELLEHSTAPRFQYRHRWRPGDVVMWDNRCLLHKANGDYDMSELRYLYRVMLKGGIPT